MWLAACGIRDGSTAPERAHQRCPFSVHRAMQHRSSRFRVISISLTLRAIDLVRRYGLRPVKLFLAIPIGFLTCCPVAHHISTFDIAADLGTH
jgi:hypothetical protein